MNQPINHNLFKKSIKNHEKGIIQVYWRSKEFFDSWKDAPKSKTNTNASVTVSSLENIQAWWSLKLKEGWSQEDLLEEVKSSFGKAMEVPRGQRLESLVEWGRSRPDILKEVLSVQWRSCRIESFKKAILCEPLSRIKEWEELLNHHGYSWFEEPKSVMEKKYLKVLQNLNQRKKAIQRNLEKYTAAIKIKIGGFISWWRESANTNTNAIKNSGNQGWPMGGASDQADTANKKDACPTPWRLKDSVLESEGWACKEKSKDSWAKHLQSMMDCSVAWNSWKDLESHKKECRDVYFFKKDFFDQVLKPLGQMHLANPNAIEGVRKIQWIMEQVGPKKEFEQWVLHGLARGLTTMQGLALLIDMLGFGQGKEGVLDFLRKNKKRWIVSSAFNPLLARLEEMDRALAMRNELWKSIQDNQESTSVKNELKPKIKRL